MTLHQSLTCLSRFFPDWRRRPRSKALHREETIGSLGRPPRTWTARSVHQVVSGSPQCRRIRSLPEQPKRFKRRSRVWEQRCSHVAASMLASYRNPRHSKALCLHQASCLKTNLSTRSYRARWPMSAAQYRSINRILCQLHHSTNNNINFWLVDSQIEINGYLFKIQNCPHRNYQSHKLY